jgi:hypothetical protein
MEQVFRLARHLADFLCLVRGEVRRGDASSTWARISRTYFIGAFGLNCRLQISVD